MKFAQEIYANSSSSSAVCTWQIEFVFSNMTNIHANILEYIHFQSNIYYADIDPIHIYFTLVIWFLNFIQPVGHCVSFPFFFTLFIKHFSLFLSLFFCFCSSPFFRLRWFCWKKIYTKTRNNTDAIDDDEFSTRPATIAAETVEAIENKSIVLSCGRTKMPDGDVKWFFNGKYFFRMFFSSSPPPLRSASFQSYQFQLCALT